MKKTTSLKLSKQLVKYGALTAAIVGVTDVNGQSVIYNDITDITGTTGGTSLLDIDSNGTNDFQITHDGSNLFIAPLTASNDVLGSGGATYAYPFNLTNGTPISSGATTWFNNGFAGGFQSLNYSSGSIGNFSDVTDGYLGLRFNIAGSTHYGWARIDVDAAGDNWTIKDWAYHDTADAALTAGQQTLSVDTNVINDIKIVALNKSIGLYNLPEATNYKLINIAGQQVLEGITNGSSFVVEANSIANGIYIIELTTVNSKAVVRKKLVL